MPFLFVVLLGFLCLFTCSKIRIRKIYVHSGICTHFPYSWRHLSVQQKRIPQSTSKLCSPLGPKAAAVVHWRHPPSGFVVPGWYKGEKPGPRTWFITQEHKQLPNYSLN